MRTQLGYDSRGTLYEYLQVPKFPRTYPFLAIGLALRSSTYDASSIGPGL
jgi:hypothetical protein